MFVKLNVIASVSPTGSLDSHRTGKDVLVALNKIESIETLRSVVYDSECKVVMETGRYFYLKETKEQVEQLVYEAIRKSTPFGGK